MAHSHLRGLGEKELASPLDGGAFVNGVTPDATLDLRGFSLGQASLTLLHNALERLPRDQILEVRVSQDGAADDYRARIRLAGHDLMADLDAGDHLRLLVRGRGFSLQAPGPGPRPKLRGDGGFDLRVWLQEHAGELPAVAPAYYGFAPRGAVVEPGGPAFPFSINHRDDVWAPNLADLYEQGKAGQWDATTDIAWSALEPLPEHLESAVCQIMTFLAENEYAALYIPAKFIPRINAQFMEPILFLAGVINDEARHIEAFTKRAWANGLGLQYSSALTEWSLHSLLVQEDYFRSSFLLHVLGEGTFLDLLDFIERFAPDPVTADVVRRARQDEGRHVAYGIAHVRHVLEKRPVKAGELVAAAEERSDVLRATSGANPKLMEALATLACGGATEPSAVERGFALVQQLFEEMHRNRVRRILQTGMTPAVAEQISLLHTPNFM